MGKYIDNKNATPLNTAGMGNPMLPVTYIDYRRTKVNPTSATASHMQKPGSGDK